MTGVAAAAGSFIGLVIGSAAGQLFSRTAHSPDTRTATLVLGGMTGMVAGAFTAAALAADNPPATGTVAGLPRGVGKAPGATVLMPASPSWRLLSRSQGSLPPAPAGVVQFLQRQPNGRVPASLGTVSAGTWQQGTVGGQTYGLLTVTFGAGPGPGPGSTYTLFAAGPTTTRMTGQVTSLPAYGYGFSGLGAAPHKCTVASATKIAQQLPGAPWVYAGSISGIAGMAQGQATVTTPSGTKTIPYWWDNVLPDGGRNRGRMPMRLVLQCQVSKELFRFERSTNSLA
jgi:hypothetical protein